MRNKIFTKKLGYELRNTNYCLGTCLKRTAATYHYHQMQNDI